MDRQLLKRACPALLLFTATLVLISTVACHREVVRRPLPASYFADGGGEPMLLAAYQPWFGRPGHMDVGYSSVDRVKLEQQIARAKQLGISAFIVNWYGPRHDFEDKAYTMLQQAAADRGFKVALMYDEDESNPSDSTDAVIVDLQYAYDRYIGPHAMVPKTSYLQYQGKPMIFIFPKGTRTDWTRVRQTVNSWEHPPLLIMKDAHRRNPEAFDGFYAWVTPGKEGWSRDGKNWGEGYLDNFYQTMVTQYPNKIAVGAAWPGFDDTRASWSQNRHMSARCGKTFDDTLRLYRRYYGPQRPLPFLMIETWNDYEEGTAIENGVETCK